MTKLVLLDAGPLGPATNPRGSAEALRCQLWLESVLANGTRIGVPEITDYEVRRELLRANKPSGLRRLDALTVLPGVSYLPITTAMMRRAADF